MTKILDDIKNLAREEIDLLNDKVFGISLLESLKFSLIPKLSDLKKRMIGAVDVLKNQYSGIRSGRASVALVEPLKAEAYGQNMQRKDIFG